MARRIRIFDTTLRDGEQSPGCSMNLGEKLGVARQLERLGVDVIEAGFAAASPGDAAAVSAIAAEIRGPVIASLARALERDIDAAWEAIRASARPRIHVFLATSPIHMEHKLKMGAKEVLERAAAMVAYAKRRCEDVEFSAEDASRSDPDFLRRVFSAVIEAGATTINMPDTVGYSVPDEFGELVRSVRSGVKGIERVVFSVHCHNDLGLAVANTLAAIDAGAEQVECTVNGIGERAGNAALEEIVMALRTRADRYGATTGVETTQLYTASRLVSSVTGVKVQPNKAVIGENAFAHEAGIHQHGVLANRATYEIMTPESVGIPQSVMVLGKHSGRHAFDQRLAQLGIRVDPKTLPELFERFKALADKKKVVSDKDIEALAIGAAIQPQERFRLDRFVINSGNTIAATSTVRLALQGGGHAERVAVGDGPIDASFKAIDQIVGKRPVLEDFALDAVTGGKDAQGEARVRIELEGRRYNGRGLSTDVVEASVRAYLGAINAMADAVGDAAGDAADDRTGGLDGARDRT
ncbi:MAG: 2-isopropylmalate synthase [Treponema sp.]|nr:2-isopropylmalate synthase [Treponema sp.]